VVFSFANVFVTLLVPDEYKWASLLSVIIGLSLLLGNTVQYGWGNRCLTIEDDSLIFPRQVISASEIRCIVMSDCGMSFVVYFSQRRFPIRVTLLQLDENAPDADIELRQWAWRNCVKVKTIRPN
jgi:hypothetical protein